MKAPICEVYPAIQGEGKHRNPTVFVRFFGCNLRCRFNGVSCDSPYAVTGNDKTNITVKELVNEIKHYKFKQITFTGGEPLLYQEFILEVYEQLGNDYFYEVETNGSIKLILGLIGKINQFNVSPKLKSSKQPSGYSQKRISIDALETFPARSSIFKFVVTCEDDIREIKKIQEVRPDIPIYLMPQGETKKEVLNNIQSTLDLCLKNEYGFTNRDHILAYGEKRKV